MSKVLEAIGNVRVIAGKVSIVLRSVDNAYLFRGKIVAPNRSIMRCKLLVFLSSLFELWGGTRVMVARGSWG
jgi:hypothetical protein